MSGPFFPINYPPIIRVRSAVDVVQAFYADSSEGTSLVITSDLPVLKGNQVKIYTQKDQWIVADMNPLAQNWVSKSIPIGQYDSLAKAIIGSMEFSVHGSVTYQTGSVHANPPPPAISAGFDLGKGGRCGRVWLLLLAIILVGVIGVYVLNSASF